MGVGAVLGSLATICGAVYGVFKLVVWLGSKTPQQKKEEIDQAVQQEEQKVEQTGRPQW